MAEPRKGLTHEEFMAEMKILKAGYAADNERNIREMERLVTVTRGIASAQEKTRREQMLTD